MRRASRPARAITQRGDPASAKALQPFIAGLGTEPKPSTKLSKVDASFAGQKHEFVTLRHGGLGYPRHRPSVTHVSERCYPCLQSIQGSSRSTFHCLCFSGEKSLIGTPQLLAKTYQCHDCQPW